MCVRCVPHNLTEQKRLKHQGSALDFLTWYNKKVDTFLSRIVTGDAIFICSRNSWIQTAIDEMVAHVIANTGEIQATNHVSQICVTRRFAGEFHVTRTNSQNRDTFLKHFCEQFIARHLENCVVQYIISVVSCFGTEFCSFMTMHDHTPSVTRNNTLRSCYGEFLITPYNPDLAPSDFPSFNYLKSFLTGKQVMDDDEVRSVATQWLQSQMTSFFEKGFQTFFTLTVNF